MIIKHSFCLLVAVGALVALGGTAAGAAALADIRGPWVGNAQGRIFGAKGSVYIMSQQGEDIRGVVEGGNAFGRAKFNISGKIRGNQIFGAMDGHTFSGLVLPDGTIRGVFRASDGDTYDVSLSRPYQYWYPYGMW